jgi:hypothetical protein
VWARYLWACDERTVEEFAWQLHAQDFACALCRSRFEFARGRMPFRDLRARRGTWSFWEVDAWPRPSGVLTCYLCRTEEEEEEEPTF